MSEAKPINWSWLGALVAGVIFVLSSAVGYGILQQQVRGLVEDTHDIKTEVKELRNSFVNFLSEQAKRTAWRSPSNN